MKRLISPFLLLISVFAGTVAMCQEITYSEIRNEENKDMSFEVLGKIGVNYVVYKNIRWKHVLTFYDKEMRIVKNHRIDFVPDRTYNIDIVATPVDFLMVYQYQRNNIVYCRAVKLDSLGEKIGEPVTIDTTRLAILSENKIYNMVPSQDKKHIMVYKMYKSHGQLNVVTKTFDNMLLPSDSTRELYDYNDRRDVYSDLSLANDGSIFYSRSIRKSTRDEIAELMVVAKFPGQPAVQIPVNLQDRYLVDVAGKYDNLNNQYLLNSLYKEETNGRIKGLFSAMVNAQNPQRMLTAFNEFPDALRGSIASSTQARFAFDDLNLEDAIIKKDGGFVLFTEDQSTQTRDGNPFNNRFYSPYSLNNNYYLYNPGYYNYYRPYGYGSPYYNQTSVRFYYNEILILSVDKDLKMQWNSVIPKQQVDDDTDNYLSFSTMNTGGEIHFIYVQKDNNRQVLSNDGLFPDGEVKRYPTLKSRERGYEFMPKFAKQVEYNVMIIPCMYRNNIAFARVVF